MILILLWQKDGRLKRIVLLVFFSYEHIYEWINDELLDELMFFSAK